MKFRSSRGAAEMPFLEHLEELRWRILWSGLAIIVATIAGFVVVTQLDVIGILIRPVESYLPDGKLHYLSVTDPFFITIKLAIALGLLAASPIVIYQVWAFLSPALLATERRAIVPAFYLGLVLFLAGAALAYFLALPVTIRFMQGFQAGSLQPMLTAPEYFGFVTKLLLGFGLIFEMPVVVMVLAAIGLVTPKFLREKRRYAIAAMAVAAAMITPGDAITLTIFLMGPLMLLYELSIGLARLMEKGRERRRAVAETVVPDAVEGA
jgi:sec-independent protein translocase protein TatC